MFSTAVMSVFFARYIYVTLGYASLYIYILAYPSVLIRLAAGTIFTSVYELLSCALQVFFNDYAHYPEGEQLLLKDYLTRHHEFFITLAYCAP